MREKVFPIFKNYFRPGDAIIVGVSGGPDSMTLLDLLAQFSQTHELRIIVAHVNHGIRGASADRDEQFVRKAALRYGCEFFCKRVKLTGSHLEEKGRAVRRAFFEQLQKKYRACFICTAHTADDQLETIIFNFVRGGGPAGLAGMRELNGFYLKPLLGIEKRELLAYLRLRKLSFRKDSTNEDTRIRRVLIRKKILPLLKRINPSLGATLARNAQIFREIDEYFLRAAQKFLAAQKKGSALFSREAFLKLALPLQRATIIVVLLGHVDPSYRFGIVRIDEILGLIGRGVGGKWVEVGKKKAKMEKGRLFIV